MGAAALTARIPLASTARRDEPGACGLAFNALGGPLVAVCGLTGGAGTSTLALLIAHQAAQESAAPVLLTEADPQRAGLAALTGQTTPHPLIALAAEVDNERVPPGTFAELPSGLRLIAAAPRPAPRVDVEAVSALLDEARAAHGLVVVDCATTWSADSPVLARATHVIWTIAATPTALARASAALDTVAPPPGRWREALAATRVTPRRAVSVRALRRVARKRCERLTLIAYDEAITHGHDDAGGVASRAVTGLAPMLRRNP